MIAIGPERFAEFLGGFHVLTEDDPDYRGLDASTAALVRRYREWRGR